MNMWKTIKLFISSTFVDLEIERDKLADKFSKLKTELIERQLSFMTYDLRWRQKHEKESIVKWCIEMVDRCEYFVAILGGRYGWRPPLDAFGKANKSNISVTEMEIEHALKTIDRDKRFFCILTKEIESNKDKTSLDNLKKKLEENKEDLMVFDDTSEMLDYIVQKIRKKINLNYSEQIQKHVEYSRLQIMEDLIREKTYGFVGRKKFSEKIWNFACSENAKNYCAIHAIAGTGKSAVTAKFYTDWLREKTSVPILRYFFTVDSNVQELMNSFAKQLQSYGLLSEEIVKDPFELRTQVRITLENISQKMIILIDAIDEVDEINQDLYWFPRNLPQNINVIISTRPVNTHKILESWTNVTSLELPPLEKQEIYQIISEYSQKHNLDITKQDKELLQKRAEGNPLYLKVALEEITSSGAGVGQLATSIDSLFEQILERLRKKYDTNVVFDYLGFLSASQEGLTEHELQEIFQQKNVADDLLLIVAKSLDNFIVPRGGVLRFFHAEFERSVKERIGRRRSREYHRELSAYFSGKGFKYHRTLKELCYQTQWGEEHEKRLQLLCDVKFLEAKAEANMVDNLIEDFNFALTHTLFPLPNDTTSIYKNLPIDKNTIELIWRALILDLRFLRHYPKSLFQCLWNRCYWYDNPGAKNYYDCEDDNYAPTTNMHLLMKKWQRQNERTWAQNLLPMEPHLDSRLRKTFSGHNHAVLAIAFHQEKQRIVSIADTDIHVWNVETGECLHKIKEHNEIIRTVVFSSDGKVFATAGDDEFIFIWNTSDGECLQIIEASHGMIATLAFTQQNSVLLSAGEDTNIVAWEVKTGKHLYHLSGHKTAVCALAVHDKLIASAAKDGKICIWENKENLNLHGHDRVVNDLCFSNDGKYLASCSKDKEIRIWDINKKTCINIMQIHNSSVNGISFIPNSDLLVSVTEDGSLCVANIKNNEITMQWKRHNWQVTALKMSLDGNLVACAARDGSVSLWDMRRYSQNKENKQIQLKGHKKKIEDICIARRNNCIVSGSGDKCIKIWDIKTGLCSKNIQTNMEIACVGCSKNESKIVTGSFSGPIGVWNLQTGNLIHTLKGHKGTIFKVLFCHNDEHIISIGDYDKTMRLWDATTGECIQIYKGHKRWIESFDINKEEKIIATGSRDKTAKIWNIKTGKCIRTIHGHEIGVTSLAFSDDGKKIATASNHKGIVRIWDTHTGSCLHVMSGHKSIIQEMKFNKKGNILASVCKSNQTCTWNTEEGILIENLEGKANLNDFYEKSYCTRSQNWCTSITRNNKEIAHVPEFMSNVEITEKHIISVYKSSNHSISISKIEMNQ